MSNLMPPPPSPNKKQRRISPRLLTPLTISPHFEIQTIPGKGLGLISLRKIDALSTVLLQEPPILAIPSTMDETDDLALGVWLEDYLRNFPPEMAAEKRTAAYQLSNAHPDRQGLAGILITNGFQLPAEEDWASCRGLFLQISRINHACEPNCAQRWVGGEKRVMMIVPVKDVEVGEEITLTYLPDGACRGVDERREWLMNEFGFWCECELCTREAEPEAEVKGEVQENWSKDVEEENKIENSKEKPAWNFVW